MPLKDVSPPTCHADLGDGRIGQRPLRIGSLSPSTNDPLCQLATNFPLSVHRVVGQMWPSATAAARSASGCRLRLALALALHGAAHVTGGVDDLAEAEPALVACQCATRPKEVT